MKIKRGFTLLLTLLSISWLCNLSAFADDPGVGGEYSTDLLRLYEIYEEKTYSEVSSVYQDAFQKYLDLSGAVANAEQFNQMREEAVKFQEQQRKKIKDSIAEITLRNEKISKSIVENLEGDLSVLRSYDAEYKVNSDQISDLLEDLDSFYIINEMYVPLEDMDEATRVFEEAKEEYDESLESPATLLGEVTNVQHMVNGEYKLNSGFGSRIDPITGKGVQFHGGNDYKAPYGTDVYAAFNGTISEADYNWAVGNYIRIDHGDGVVTLYGHLDSFVAEVGQEVKQYETIAISGNSGALTTGPHLHFALYLRGVRVDPEVLYGHLGR
jgi:murein DD-endopeptidase MepM/ murein hydrolase activator NlpD